MPYISPALVPAASRSWRHRCSGAHTSESHRTSGAGGDCRRQHPPPAYRHGGHRRYWGSALRPHLDQITARSPLVTGARLGDRAASACWARACYLLDYTYAVCTDAVTGSVRYRSGFARLCAPETRGLPLYLDSAAYREAAGTAPCWSSYRRYCEAIDLIRPDGAMARDVLDDQVASREGYDRLCRDGYRDVVIPVWQVRPGLGRERRRRQ